MHLSNGGMEARSNIHKTHTYQPHRASLVNNTKIICTNNYPYPLSILEALYIRKLSPSISKQITSSHHTFKLFNSYMYLPCVCNPIYSFHLRPIFFLTAYVLPLKFSIPLLFTTDVLSCALTTGYLPLFYRTSPCAHCS